MANFLLLHPSAPKSEQQSEWALSGTSQEAYVSGGARDSGVRPVLCRGKQRGGPFHSTSPPTQSRPLWTWPDFRSRCGCVITFAPWRAWIKLFIASAGTPRVFYSLQLLWALSHHVPLFHLMGCPWSSSAMVNTFKTNKQITFGQGLSKCQGI